MKRIFLILLSLSLFVNPFILKAENNEWQTSIKSSNATLFSIKITLTQKDILLFNKVIYDKLSKYDDDKLDKLLKTSSDYKLNTTNENKILITLIEKQIVLLKNNRKLQENKEFENLLNNIKNWIKQEQNKETKNIKIDKLPTDFSDL